MTASPSHRKALLLILLTWFAYLGFVFLTDWQDYHLVADPRGYGRWRLVRLATVTLWLAGAGVLLGVRRAPVNWRSFVSALAAACGLAVIFSAWLVHKNMNHLAIAGTIGFYGMVSGLLCLTVQKPKIAGVVGLLLFLAQFLVDATAHIFSGVFRFH